MIVVKNISDDVLHLPSLQGGNKGLGPGECSVLLEPLHYLFTQRPYLTALGLSTFALIGDVKTKRAEPITDEKVTALRKDTSSVAGTLYGEGPYGEMLYHVDRGVDIPPSRKLELYVTGFDEHLLSALVGAQVPYKHNPNKIVFKLYNNKGILNPALVDKGSETITNKTNVTKKRR